MCGPEHNPVNPEFPSGIRLLSYLFELARDNISSSHYLVLLSFLQSSCQPYFLFLQRWLFEGVLFDPYGEFMIQMNEQYLAFRDKNYWTLGYVAASKDCVPLFLSDLWKAILTCGKTVNLLKLCTRANPLCNMSISPPKISIHFSLRRLREVEDTSVWYAEHLRLQLEDAGHQRVLLREAEQKIKHQESLNQRQKMAEAIEMEDELKEKQRVEDESKKRALFETLKKQMEEDMQRRDSIEQQNREADLTWMNRLLAKEAAVDAAKRELEEHVRQELIEHYEQLAQDAARREARALWQASRTALSEARRQFLLADMNHWNTRDDVSDATLPHIQSPEKGETAKLVSPVETLNETISVSTETILGQTRKSNPVVYSPVGIIPGVFAVDEDPISLEEARRRIGIDSPNTDESETIKSDQDSVDTSQLTENIQLTLPFEYAEDAIENSSHSKDTATTYSNHPTESKNIPSSGGCDDNNSAIVSILVDRPESGRRQWNSDGQKLFPMSQDAVCIQSPVQSDLVQPSSRGHEPSSVVQDIMYSQSQGLPEGSRFNTRGMPPPSVVQDLIYAKSDVLSSDFAVAVSRGQEPCSAGQGVITESQVLSVSSRSSSQEISQPFQCSSIGNKTSDEPANMANTTETQSSSDDEFHSDEADRLESDGFQDRIVSTRGHEPPSVMQDIIYSQDSQAEVFRTTRGHAPKSTIQNLMYPKDLSQESSESSLSPHMVEFDAFNDPVIASFQGQAEPYDEGDSWLDDPACSDLMDKVRLRSVSLTETDDDHLGALNSLSLPELFNRSIAIPVATQVSVVNKAVVAYFIEDLCIQDHFQAIRHFLLLEDGEFGHALASGLFSKLSSGISSADLCSVGVMNNLLADSLGVSLGAGFDHMSCLSFSLKFRPQALNQSDIRALDFLELRYKVPWPVNIIITETAITKYGKLFTFMLQLKRATWALKDLGQRLKRSGQQMNTQNCEQLHKLNLFRREMQHFVTVMEGYVVNQIIHVSCLEFQQDLKEVDGLHGLRECHATYLNKMLYRSLLTKKAGPVLKVVHDILSLVLQFHTQLLSGHWRMRGTHPAFDNMCRTYARFKEFSGFLFTVVAKLVDRGYQPHLEDLLLRLNFNDYYSNQTTAR
ncbi:gamma-tubulin complex component 6-like isoform X2 [Corticium candelabrum]|nr:gamma-tubulin complex component 6-like isoform X2 [Corticium candelabrum]